MRDNYKLEEFKAEVVATVKELRKFVSTNKVLDKEDSEALFECLKYLIDINGDVNQLMQRWSRVNVRVYSLLVRMEANAGDLRTVADIEWKETYIQLVRDEGSKDHVAKALADTSVEYQKKDASARQCGHLVKFLERTYKLSESVLRILEHLSNNARADLRDSSSSSK